MEIKQRINVSGYRGIWGENLNEEVVILYTRAFVSFTKEKNNNPTILIGRDGRENGPIIRDIILKELTNLGIKAVDGDILPTPTVLFSVRKHGYDGAIIITASHNPIEYNGLKLVNDKALFTIKEEVEKINKYYEKEIKKYEKTGILETENIENKKDDTPCPNFTKEHADQILAHVNVKAIRAKKFKIVVDMINASACVMDPYLLEQLGVEYRAINSIPNGKFGHRPEPLRENLTDISKLAKETKADLGFVHDPDADRLVILDENGEVISEEYPVTFAIESVLAKNPGRSAVINLSTSQMDVDIAKKYGSKCFRTKIGEGFVVDGMMAHDAIVGGEGNGGMIYPTINTARDSFTGLAIVLELLAERNKKVSEIVNEFPKYFMKKDKQPVAGKNLKEMYDKLKVNFKDAQVDEQDGIRFDFPDSSWIHLRPSNTEPIIRLFGEARTQEEVEALFKETYTLLA